MKLSAPDFSLYFILDYDFALSVKKNPVSVLRAALKGGATAVQLRAKSLETLDFYALSVVCQKVCALHNVPFIINDRADLALAVNATGLHIGQSDLPYSVAKTLLGKNKIIGISASTEKEALLADTLKASYIGFGPVFPTSTKIAKVFDIKKLPALVKKIKTPLVAIGGIKEYTIKTLSALGIKNFALISEITAAENIKEKTKNILAKIKNFK